MTNLRGRIAEVIAEHSVCECGDYAEDSDEHFSHIADMLIETLGLKPETDRTGGPMGWMPDSIRYVTEWNPQ